MSFRNSEDQELDLSCEGIVDVPIHLIATNLRAVIIDLSNNHIRSLSVDFATSLRHIVQLDLSKNLLQKLPENFGYLVNLRHLDLYSNKIERLPLSMSKLRKLKWLDLKDNPLVPSLKKIVGECWNAEQCFACSKNVVAFMAQVEQQVVGEQSGENNSSDLQSSQRHSQQMPNMKKRVPASFGGMTNGFSTSQVLEGAKVSQEFSSEEDADSEVMSRSRDDESTSQKKKRKRNANKRGISALPSEASSPLMENTGSSEFIISNLIWLGRSAIWMVLFCIVFLLLCSLCLSSDGFKSVIISLCPIEKLNVGLISQHTWIQTEILRTDRFAAVKDLGRDWLTLSANYFYTLVESLYNSVEALVGAIGK